jgi:hypothetical protein
MNFRTLFTRKSHHASATASGNERLPEGPLDLDTLDACVGGRVDMHGVDCYAHSTQPRSH